MKKNDNENAIDNQNSALEDYVTVAIADDVDLANEYRDILARHSIPAVTATQKSYSSSILGTAVLVPESMLEEAQELIESQQDFDNYLDNAFNDPDNWNDDQTEDHENYGNYNDNEEII